MKSKYDIFTKKELTDFLDACERNFDNIFYDTPMEAMLDKKMDELSKQMRKMIPLESDSADEARKKFNKWKRLNNEYEKLFRLRFGKEIGEGAK